MAEGTWTVRIAGGPAIVANMIQTIEIVGQDKLAGVQRGPMQESLERLLSALRGATYEADR